MRRVSGTPLDRQAKVLLDGPDPALEDLDPLLELLVGELEQRPGFPGLAVEVLAILGVTPIDVRVEALGQEPDVLSQVFDEHTSVIDLLSEIDADVGDLLLKARPRVGDLLPEPLGGRGDQPLNLSE